MSELMVQGNTEMEGTRNKKKSRETALDELQYSVRIRKFKILKNKSGQSS
jgi:hypothetical protein